MNRTVKNHTFTSKRGNPVEVFQTFEVGTRNGFSGLSRCVRTFAVVCGVEVDMEAGCAFKASSAVAQAGF